MCYNRRMNETAFYRETNAKTLRGPYLLLGSEELTKQEALDRVLKLLDPGFSEMNLHRLKEPDAQTLIGAADQLPFFDAFHIVVVSDWSDADLFESLSAEEKKRAGIIDRFFALPDAIVLFTKDLPRLTTEGDIGLKFFESVDALLDFDKSVLYMKKAED